MLFLFVPVISLAGNVNPKNISETDAKLQKQITNYCRKYSNIQANINCVNKMSAKDAGKFRGTIGYAKNHYKGLASDVLYNKLLELKALKKHARTSEEAMLNPVSGEITKEDYQVEISWITEELNKRHYTPPAHKPYSENEIRVIR